MARRSNRIGKFNDSFAVSENLPEAPVSLHSTTQGTKFTTASYRGKSKAQFNTISFDEFIDLPIIYFNKDRIFEEIIKGRSESSVETLKKGLRLVGKFFAWLKASHGIDIVNVGEIDLNISTLIYLFLKEELGSYRKINFFRRFFRAIGVPKQDIPINTFISVPPDPTDVMPIEMVVKMYNHFKKEAQIIIQRQREFNELKGLGRDPRREFGGRHGDWAIPSNRMFIVLNVIGTDIKPVDDNRKNGLRNALAGLQNHPGAMVLRLNGIHNRKVGLTGHLAYLYPSARDLLPFVCLLMIKTRFNVSVITGLRVGKYVFRPLALKFGDGERTVQFAAPKFRSVNDADAEPSYVHTLCLVRPFAHPFRVIKFVESLTEPLRAEIHRKIKQLRGLPVRTKAEADYLERLNRIKSDLFIYYAEGKIGSLGSYLAERGDIPTVYPLSFAALGFPTSLAAQRSAALAFGANFSGVSQSIVTLLGDHKNNRTSVNYRNRKTIHERWQKFFIELFGLSISLIDQKIYSKKRIKTLLREQGLSKAEMTALLDTGNITKWGNRCSDPMASPPGFDIGTTKGGRCVGQACIDGCSRARWFPDALEIASKRRAEMMERLSVIGFAASANSVIHDRIMRCETIISTIVAARSR